MDAQCKGWGFRFHWGKGCFYVPLNSFQFVVITTLQLKAKINVSYTLLGLIVCWVRLGLSNEETNPWKKLSFTRATYQTDYACKKWNLL